MANVPKEVFFPAYFEFLHDRKKINDAVMALLAGSNLAAHFLQLTRGSRLTLLEVFPNVPHVKTFDLKSEAALIELENSAHHLTNMALPYLLGSYEAFLLKTCDFISKHSNVKASYNSRSSSENLHEFLRDNFEVKIRRESTRIFTLLTHLRHDIIHNGSVARQNFGAEYEPDIRSELGHWHLVPKGVIPNLSVGDKIVFGYAELILTLAVVKDLARQVNQIAKDALTDKQWAQVILEEKSTEASFSGKNRAQKILALTGLARTRYRALNLSSAVFEEILK